MSENSYPLIYMNPLACRALVRVVAIALASLVTAVAQTVAPAPNAPLPIEVATVRFNSVRADAGTWFVTEIELQPRGGEGAKNRNFINRVKVTLNLGVFSVMAPAGSKVPDTYYRASAEAVAVEATGSRSVYRFYLPPEIVKRDQINGDLKYYLVEVFVDGKALPLGKNNFPISTLSKPEIVESFRGKVSGSAGANDGILLPQYLTPFANGGSPPAPSFIRLETAR
ncbi:MAG: hypothetical protein H2170_06985 [Opitutus sp.]|nr:hypothetical protein [Opitutus sp.]